MHTSSRQKDKKNLKSQTIPSDHLIAPIDWSPSSALGVVSRKHTFVSLLVNFFGMILQYIAAFYAKGRWPVCCFFPHRFVQRLKLPSNGIKKKTYFAEVIMSSGSSVCTLLLFSPACSVRLWYQDPISEGPSLYVPGCVLRMACA